MSSDRKFPIMGNDNIKSVPWAVAEFGRKQAEKNHGQSLERLAERGGLDVLEMAWALTGVGWRGRDLTVAQAENIIKIKTEQHHGRSADS